MQRWRNITIDIFGKESYKRITDIVHPDLFYDYRKTETDKLINRKYLYAHNRRLYSALRKIKHLFAKGR